NEQASTIRDGAIGRYREFPLASAIVRKWKRQSSNGFIPILAPTVTFLNPFKIEGSCFLEEIAQIRARKGFAEFGDFVRFKVEVGQLDGDFFRITNMRVNEGINFCLGPMERVGHAVPCAADSFDFLQQHFFGGVQQTINPAMDAQYKIAGCDLVRDANFFLVSSRTCSL